MTRGNYAKTGENVLVTIVQVSPIRVCFSMSNRRFFDLFSGLSRRLREESVASVSLANGTPYAGKGSFDYVENTADQRTDTIQVYYQYENPDGLLRPAGTISVTLSSKKGAMRPFSME